LEGLPFLSIALPTMHSSCQDACHWSLVCLFAMYPCVHVFVFCACMYVCTQDFNEKIPRKPSGKTSQINDLKTAAEQGNISEQVPPPSLSTYLWFAYWNFETRLLVEACLLCVTALCSPVDMCILALTHSY